MTQRVGWINDVTGNHRKTKKQSELQRNSMNTSQLRQSHLRHSVKLWTHHGVKTWTHCSQSKQTTFWISQVNRWWLVWQVQCGTTTRNVYSVWNRLNTTVNYITKSARFLPRIERQIQWPHLRYSQRTKAAFLSACLHQFSVHLTILIVTYDYQTPTLIISSSGAKSNSSTFNDFSIQIQGLTKTEKVTAVSLPSCNVTAAM